MRKRWKEGVRERQIGDVSEPERDRYMFLETLVSTREAGDELCLP